MKLENISKNSELSPLDKMVKENFDASLSESTRKNYASALKKWKKKGGKLPADPYLVAVYLAALSKKVGYPTVKMAAAAIASAHKDAGLANPFDNPGLKKVMAGMSNKAQHEPKQVDGITSDKYKDIVKAARIPRKKNYGRMESPEEAHVRGTMDIALIGLMRDAMLRRAEAAALTWADFWLENDKGRILIRKSKTDQKGEGRVLFASHNTTAMLLQWQRITERPEVMFPISGHQICRRIASAAKSAGLEGKYSGHSPRIGMAQDLARYGCSLAELMEAGRWKSPSMPAYYLRSTEAGRGAVAKFYGED